ncbi:hypothetical protein LTR56_009146 [Elasticomyces elasticus]|nr:hypothetical protein LTR56_009146 [Elasticomyces elasticus]KAK3660616.1 hypothetical protein LTR22_007863 [Elasticomyces elasticus]KAK4915581.1 hypothetical protein LTR49_016304 [Elasticomyces elasticus]KAK5755053.1 hypothetical protein LTS12_014853 [Elasticomyces elasticus]
MRKVTAAVPAGRVHPFALQDGCKLLSIPPELRNRIYEELLLLLANEDGYIVLSNDQAANQQGKFTVLSILGTCQQIEGESMGIFYALNKLHVRRDLGYYHSMTNFATSLGHTRRVTLRHLACNIQGAEEITSTLQMLHALGVTRLASLRMYVDAEANHRVELFCGQFRAELWFLRKILLFHTHLQRIELVIKETVNDGQHWDYEANRPKMAEVEGQIDVLLKHVEEGAN